MRILLLAAIVGLVLIALGILPLGIRGVAGLTVVALVGLGWSLIRITATLASSITER